jgi:hypothetical protein
VQPERPDERGALTVLAGSRGGCTTAVLMGHGVTLDAVAGLIAPCSAIEHKESIGRGPRPIEVTRAHITDRRRKALP